MNTLLKIEYLIAGIILGFFLTAYISGFISEWIKDYNKFPKSHGIRPDLSNVKSNRIKSKLERLSNTYIVYLLISLAIVLGVIVMISI